MVAELLHFWKINQNRRSNLYFMLWSLTQCMENSSGINFLFCYISLIWAALRITLFVLPAHIFALYKWQPLFQLNVFSDLSTNLLISVSALFAKICFSWHIWRSKNKIKKSFLLFYYIFIKNTSFCFVTYILKRFQLILLI